jgi:hypothetical protein
MASTIYFGGRTIAIPGSYSQVDANGLAKVGLGATGIVACIGEAEGGEPGVVLSATNPGRAARFFRSGDLREASAMLFDPSRDPGIPGGAQEVKFVKVNPATASTRTLVDGTGANSLTLTSRDFGAFTKKINVAIGDGTLGGKSVAVEFDGVTESWDNVGQVAPISLEIALAYPGFSVTYDRTTGLSGDLALASVGDETGAFDNTITVSGDATGFTQPASPSVLTVVSTSGSDTAKTVTIYGANGSGSPVNETLTLNGTTPVTGSTTFAAVYGLDFSAAAVGTVSLKDAVPATLWTGNNRDGLLKPGSVIEVWRPDNVTIVADAATTSKVMLLGTNSSGTPTSEIVTLNGTTPVSSSTTWASISGIGIAGVPSARILTLSAWWWQSGERAVVVSSSASDTGDTVTIYGLSTSGNPQVESVVTNGTTPVLTTGTWGRVLGWDHPDDLAGTLTLRGNPASGSDPTIVVAESAPGDGGAGARWLPTGLQIQNNTLSWTASLTASDYALLVGVDEDGAFAAEKIALASSGTTTTVWSQLDYIVGPFPFGLSGDLFDLPPAEYPYVSDWLTFFGTQPFWSVSANIGGLSSFPTTRFDEVAGLAVSTTAVALPAVQYAIVSILNNESSLVSAAVAASSTTYPANTATPLFLTGGIEGATTFSNWQAALDLIRDERVNSIVILTSDEAVHAAAVSHCVYMAGPGRSERDCLLGAASGTTLTQAKARAVALNTRHARLFVQDVERFNTAGVREQFPPYFTACVAAGMQAGAPVGTSLTFKYPNVLDVIGDDTTFTVRDDASDLIQSGLCVLEKVPNIGHRFLRNVTTHLIDDNLAYVEASVNAAVNFAAYELRTALEIAVGKPGFAGTVNAALGVSVGILGQLVGAGAITAYRNLTIELTDDVMTVDVEIAPIIPVNFVRTTLHLVSASFTA